MNRIINVKRVADLGDEPITLAEAKTQLRVDFTDDDTEITRFISKARRFVENYLNISIVYQRIECIAVWEHGWKLPYGPVIDLESVADSTSPSGSGPATFTTTTSDWDLSGDEFTPSVTCIKYKTVYTAGNFCPDDIRDVILELLTFLYENRGRDPKQDDILPILKKADHHKVLIWI